MSAKLLFPSNVDYLFMPGMIRSPLAAMNPTAHSHESLFDTACRIGIILVGMQRLFLSMLMNVLGGNVK